jgi:hypothetical protein
MNFEQKVDHLDKHVRAVLHLFEDNLTLPEGAQVLLACLALTMSLAEEMKDTDTLDKIHNTLAVFQLASTPEPPSSRTQH